MLKHWIKRLAAKAGYSVFSARDRYQQDGLFTIHNDEFRRDAEFRSAYKRGLTAAQGVDPAFEWRVHVALWAAATALQVPGSFVECGVNAGFLSSAILHHLQWNSRDRHFFLIDTFSGPVLRQYSEDEVQHGRLKIAEEALAAGAYVTDLQRVRANYSQWPQAVVVCGAVPEILDTVDTGPVAFLHIDMNCAYPERAALEYFWPKLQRGGVVLLDDYAYFGHEQQKKAIDATALRLGAHVLSLPTGQGLIVK